MTSSMRQKPCVHSKYVTISSRSPLSKLLWFPSSLAVFRVTPWIDISWAIVWLCCVYTSILACFHLRKKKLFIWWYDGGVFLVLESHFCAMGCFGNNNNEDEKKQKDTSKRIEKQLRDDKIAYRATHRLLLLGNNFWSCMAVLLGFEGGWFWFESIE